MRKTAWFALSRRAWASVLPPSVWLASPPPQPLLRAARRRIGSLGTRSGSAAGHSRIETTAPRRRRPPPEGAPPLTLAPAPAVPRKRYFPEGEVDENAEERRWERVARNLLSNVPSSTPSTANWDDWAHWDAAVQAVRYWTTRRTPKATATAFAIWDATFAAAPPDAIPSHLSAGNYPVVLHVFNALLDSWRIVWERGMEEGHGGSAVDDPYQVWERLKVCDSPGRTDARSHTILLAALGHYPDRCRTERREEAPPLADAVWERLLRMADEQADEVELDDDGSSPHITTEAALARRPDVVAFTALLRVWARSGRSDAPSRALELWSEWHDWVVARRLRGGSDNDFELDERVRPNVVTYNTLLQLLCDSRPRDKWLAVAERVLEYLLDPSSGAAATEAPSDFPHALLPPDLTGFGLPPEPNALSFHAVVVGYAKAGQFSEAAAWLRRMVNEGHPGHPDTFSDALSRAAAAVSAASTAVFDATAVTRSPRTQRNPEAAAKSPETAIESAAAAVGEEIIQLYRARFGGDDADGGGGVPPLDSFSPHWTRALIKWYAATDRPREAELELDRLKASDHLLVENGGGRRSVRRRHYLDVLHAWLRTRTCTRREAARRSDDLVFRLLVSERCIGEVQDEEDSNGSSTVLDAPTINAVLGLWTVTAKLDGPAPWPDDVENRPEERAERLLRLVRGVPGAAYDAASYHKVMKAWAEGRRPGSGPRAEALLRELEEHWTLRPSRFHYTEAVQAWSVDPTADPAVVSKQLERIMESAEQQAARGNSGARPDATLLGSLLHAYARLGDGPAAELAFDRLWDLHWHGGSARRDNPPGTREMNLVVLAWQRSKDGTAAKKSRALRFLRQAQEQRKLLPDKRTEQLLKSIRQR